MVLPYLIELLGGADPVDLGPVVRMDKLTDVGTGEVNSAQLTFDAEFGRLIADQTGPILDQFDNIRIRLTDNDSVVYDRIMFVDTIMPQQGAGGRLVQLELFGRERFLQLMRFPGHFFFVSVDSLIRRIVAFYNDNRGTAQPEIRIGSEYEVPGFVVGTFDFGDNMTAYDCLMQLVQRLNLSVAAGGAGDFYELLFEDDPADQNVLLMLVMSQGSRGNMPLTGSSPDVSSITRNLEPVDSEIIVCEGQDDAGTLPVEVGLWTALNEEFNNFPDWRNDLEYAEGAYVRFEGSVYRAMSGRQVGAALPGSGWVEVSLGEYVGNDFVYSPWTHRKSAVIRKFTTNPPANYIKNNYGSPAFPDSNLVVRDVGFWRDWVDFRVSSMSQIPDEYLYVSGSGNRSTYEGMRLLLDPAMGSPGSPFGSGGTWGTDKNGNPYRNSVVTQDEDGDWIVFRTTNPSASYPHIRFNRGDQVVVMRTATSSPAGVHEYSQVITTPNPIARRGQTVVPADLGWRILNESYLGNDCLHWPVNIEEVDGLIMPVPRPQPTTAMPDFTSRNGVRITYEVGERAETVLEFLAALVNVIGLNLILGAAEDVLSLFFTREAFEYGWWATLFEMPFPPHDGGISEDVGQLFGGTHDRRTPLLDLNNLNHTPSGQTGFGADDAQNLGPLSGISFLFNFDMFIANVRQPFAGDIPFRCTIYDNESNVWIQDVIYRHLGETQHIFLPFSGFSIYRARRPIGTGAADILQNILTPELSVLEVFERRKVKRVTFQMCGSYDSFGRYNPANFENVLRALFTGFAQQTFRTQGTIDALCFTKRPLGIAQSGNAGLRHTQTAKRRYPAISNIAQLRKIASGELALAQHRRETFGIRTAGFCDIKPGHSAVLTERDLYPSMVQGVLQSRRLAVRKATYTIAPNHDGFTREVSVYQRINA